MSSLAARVEHRHRVTELCERMNQQGIHIDRDKARWLRANFNDLRKNLFPKHYVEVGKRKKKQKLVYVCGFNPFSTKAMRNWLTEHGYFGLKSMRGIHNLYVQSMRREGFHPDEPPPAANEALCVMYQMIQYQSWSLSVLNWVSGVTVEKCVYPRWSSVRNAAGSITATSPTLPPATPAGLLSRELAIPHPPHSVFTEVKIIEPEEAFSECLLLGTDIHWAENAKEPCYPLPWRIGTLRAFLTGNRLAMIKFGSRQNHLRQEAIALAVDLQDSWYPALTEHVKAVEEGVLECPGGRTLLYGDVDTRWKTACGFAYRAARAHVINSWLLEQPETPVIVMGPYAYYNGPLDDRGKPFRYTPNWSR